MSLVDSIPISSTLFLEEALDKILSSVGGGIRLVASFPIGKKMKIYVIGEESYCQLQLRPSKTADLPIYVIE